MGLQRGPGSGLICQEWYVDWHERQSVRTTAKYVIKSSTYAIVTQIFKWSRPALQKRRNILVSPMATYLFYPPGRTQLEAQQEEAPNAKEGKINVSSHCGICGRPFNFLDRCVARE